MSITESGNMQQLQTLYESVQELGRLSSSFKSMQEHLYTENSSHSEIAPKFRYMLDLVYGMEHCTNNEHRLKVINTVLTNFQGDEDNLSMYDTLNQQAMAHILGVTLVLNARNTLSTVVDHVHSIEQAIENGFIYEDRLNKINEAIQNLMDTEIGVNDLKSTMIKQQKPATTFKP